MEGFTLFLKGLAVGFVIAAPAGPIGVLCVRRTLVFGRLAGLASGFGATLADTFYGAVAAFGVTLVSGWLLSHAVAFRLAGGAFLAVLGARMLLSHRRPPPLPDERPGRSLDLPHAFATAFIVTLTNPMTIVAFLGIFAALGVGELTGDRRLALTLVAGVFVGAATWWLLLAGGANLLRDRLNRGGLSWVNRVSGTIMLVFGAYALISGALRLI
jgi:threonine/homoserine/homoserine lactone efflux protein